MDILTCNKNATLAIYQISGRNNSTGKFLAFTVINNVIETTFHDGLNTENYDDAYEMFDRINGSSAENEASHHSEVGFNL